jgi:hypothetical protein
MAIACEVAPPSSGAVSAASAAYADKRRTSTRASAPNGRRGLASGKADPLLYSRIRITVDLVPRKLQVRAARPEPGMTALAIVERCEGEDLNLHGSNPAAEFLLECVVRTRISGCVDAGVSGSVPRERAAVHQPLKNSVEVGHVALGTLVTPPRRAEQTDVHEVVAGATAELEPPHGSAIRRGTAAPLADFGRGSFVGNVDRGH